MKISIIIPFHNEEENFEKQVKNVLALVKRAKLDVEIICVDDNSSDKTPALCDEHAKRFKNIRTMHRKINPGMGNALKEGTRMAKGNIVVWIMGDLSDDLNTIPAMIEKIDQGADMVFASRYMKGGDRGSLSFFKAISSSGFTILTRLVLGIRVHDITNAFRAFRKEVFDSIKLESGDFAISPEFAIRAHLRGYKLDEAPTTYFDRTAGKTKFKFLRMGITYLSLFKYRFKKF